MEELLVKVGSWCTSQPGSVQAAPKMSRHRREDSRGIFPPLFSFLFLGLEWFVHSLSCSCAWMVCYWDSSLMRIIIIIIFCWCLQNGFSVLDCLFITLDRWCFVFGGFCIESPISSPPSQLFLDLILLLFLVYSLPTPSLSLTSNNSQAFQFKPATGCQRLTAFFSIILLSAFFIWKHFFSQTGMNWRSSNVSVRILNANS